MARELDARPAGFYHAGERWTRAHFTSGILRIQRTISWAKDHAVYESKGFADVSNEVFGDGNGGTICASRQVRRSS